MLHRLIMDVEEGGFMYVEHERRPSSCQPATGWNACYIATFVGLSLHVPGSDFAFIEPFANKPRG